MSNPIHPGQYVRDNILKTKGISVSKAAEHIGISRTGVSSFLNGKVSATPNMATRIEKAFGFPAEKLMQLQKAYDLETAENDNELPPPSQYAPPFLKILSNDIEKWADGKIEPRQRLPVLLRTLVHSTGRVLKKVDFPGNNNAQKKGWDGFVDSDEATPWIPQGVSGWEFGCNKEPSKKAEKDYAQRVRSLPFEERSNLTFVFVTPRIWPGKESWLEDKRGEKQFLNVYAHDASDLEQWIETSLAAQTWFAQETDFPTEGVRTLEECWNEWLRECEGKISGKLFDGLVAESDKLIKRRLNSEESTLLTIAADSVGEALSFLYQFFAKCEEVEMQRLSDKALVFDRPETLKKLADGLSEHIVVSTNSETERQFPHVPVGASKVIVTRKNAANVSPDIVLQPISSEAFRVGLEEADFSRDDISRLDRESGRSLTILRRRLSPYPAVRSPKWCEDSQTANSLVPFLLTGKWVTKNDSDNEVLRLMSNGKTQEFLDDTFHHLLRLEDSPVWNVGSHRGLASSIDALFAISAFVKDDDLKRFFEIAEIVLGEDNPALDLSEQMRFAAALYGKKREFSSTLRKSVSEMFLLIAIYGPELFADRSINIDECVCRVVDNLLMPVNGRKLESLDRDISVLAEAAPNRFLTILEEDLAKDSPEAFSLFRAVDSVLFGGCPRSGLLWALETIAWDAALLDRIVLALGKLATIEIDDNVMNRPINSLLSIFRSWMPQTSANHEGRLAALRLLINRFPQIGWNVCLDQIKVGPQTGHYNSKAKWRSHGQGFGEPFETLGPALQFQDEAAKLLLEWDSLDAAKLCDLIGRVHGFSPQDQAQLWQRIEGWAEENASDYEKAEVREKVRVSVLSNRARRHRGQKNGQDLVVCAKKTMDLLEPNDLMLKHAWLFKKHWLDESADELADEDFDYKKREERVRTVRADALREIYETEGLAGVIRFAGFGNASGVVGQIMASDVLNVDLAAELASLAMSDGISLKTAVRNDLVSGVLRTRRDPNEQEEFLRLTLEKAEPRDHLGILLLAPVERITWRFVGMMKASEQANYWQRLNPGLLFCDVIEKQEAVRQLIKAKRPRAAFSAVSAHVEEMEPQLLFDLMSEIVTSSVEKSGEYKLDQYDIERAFGRLDSSKQFDLERMASLEFAYIGALSKLWDGRGKHVIPNLNDYIAKNPEFFVQAIVWAYDRSDEQSDPENWAVPEDTKQDRAMAGYKLLEGVTRTPGYSNDGILIAELLIQWITRVREVCGQLSRAEVGDVCIGQLLSHSPKGEGGVWPCEPVADALEAVRSDHISEGLHTGRYNSRGAVWRGDGGAQERELAEMYRKWAERFRYTHPYVSGGILTSLAKTYEREADNEDLRVKVRRRLN